MMPSYLTIPEAQLYFNTRLHTEPWDCAIDSEKTKALAMSTKIIDRLNYEGEKTNEAQVNQFPRDADIVVPEDIGDATAEIALSLLDGVDPELEFENLAMTTQQYGTIKSSYDRSINQQYKVAGVPSMTAWRMLVPYLQDSQGIDLNRVS